MNKRKLGRSAVSACIIAGILLVLILINFLFGKIDPKRTKFDMTPSGMFEISEQTRSILENLDSDMDIYWLVESGNENSTFQLLFERYQSITDKIRITKIDPQDSPTFVGNYTDNYSNNSLILDNGERSKYLDYYQLYEYDNTSIAGRGTSVNIRFVGESVIASAINYVDKGVSYHLYSIRGHGETELPESYKSAVTKENIVMDTLSLAEVSEIPEDASLILLNAPISDLSDAELELLNAYLDRGGSMLLVSQPPKSARLANFDLLTERYGVRACDGIVFEDNDRYYILDMQYYLIPEMPATVSHSITAPLQKNGLQVVIPIAQGLRFYGEQPASVTAVPLFITSETSYAKLSGSGSSFQKEEGDIDGPFFLGMAFEEETENNSISRAVWIPTAHITNESVNEMSSGANEELFLNAVDWLCGQDESVIAVRSKNLTEDHLRIDSRTATVLSVLIIGVLPILYLGIGLYLRIRRKRR